MKKRIVCLFLSVLMLLSCLLVSCGTEQQSSATGSGQGNNATAEKDPTEVYDAEIKNLNGHEFRFYAKDHTAEHYKVKEFYAESPTGDRVNDAVFQRNAQIQATYNCTISLELIPSSGSGVHEALRDPLMAGEYVCDFVYAAAYNMITLASANLLVDLKDMDNLDLSKAWWDQGLTTGVNVGGKVFMINGSAGVLDDVGAWIMSFNKDQVMEYRSDLNLYDEVRKGTWTMDLFYEIMSNTWRDLNGDGVLKPNTDRFGYNGSYVDGFVFMLTSGLTLVNYSAQGDIEVPDQPKTELLDAWAKLRPFFTSPYRLVTDNTTYVRNGKSTFYSGTVGAVVLKSGERKVNLGLLPIPKLTEAQDKYYTTVYFGNMPVISVPGTVENGTDWEANGFSSGAEQCAYFLELLGYYSHSTLKPAFYDQVILKQHATDSESAQMVEIALENKIYDPVAGYRWGNLVNAFYVNSYDKENESGAGATVKYDNLVSYYVARVSSARKSVEQYIEAINTEVVGM